MTTSLHLMTPYTRTICLCSLLVQERHLRSPLPRYPACRLMLNYFHGCRPTYHVKPETVIWMHFSRMRITLGLHHWRQIASCIKQPSLTWQDAWSHWYHKQKVFQALMSQFLMVLHSCTFWIPVSPKLLLKHSRIIHSSCSCRTYNICYKA